MKNFIDRAKFFFSKDKEFRAALYDIMGFYPHNVEYYRIAFAHKSSEYKSKKTGNKPLNNERLEFLGDAVLETVVSDIVYRHFPNKREGFLTNTRSKIVSRESLGRLAKDLGIDRLIQSQTHTRTHNSYLAGNSFEALMGAIYLDRGFPYAFRFVEKRIIGAVLDLEGVAQKEVNFKSKLLEWSQKNRIRMEFKESNDTSSSGNNPSFHTTIVIEGLFAGDGKGFSKKESHQNAAKDALTQLRREPQFLDSIFRSKEKRTAMEANEMFVLPKIDEIEAEIAKSKTKAEAPKHEKNAETRKEQHSATRKERHEKSKPEKTSKDETPTQAAERGERKKAVDTSSASNAPATSDTAAEKTTSGSSRTAKGKAQKPQTDENQRAGKADSTPAAAQGPAAETPQAEESADTRSGLSGSAPLSPDNSADNAPAETPVAPAAPADNAAADLETDTEKATSTAAPEKRKRRRAGRAQSATAFANTELPPAEQSRRAQKAERKAQEEAQKRALTKARGDLFDEEYRPAPDETEASQTATSAADKPQRNARRNAPSTEEATARTDKRNTRRRAPAVQQEPSSNLTQQREDLIAAAEAEAYGKPSITP